MHDVPSTPLSHPELPSTDPMVKVGSAAAPEAAMEMLSKDDPDHDSEGLSIETDSTTEMEPPSSQELVDTHVDTTEQTMEKQSAPQPVTPESPKVLGEMAAAAPMVSIPRIAKEEKKANDTEPSEVSEEAPAAKKKSPKKEASEPKEGQATSGDVVKKAERTSGSKSRRSRSKYDDDGSSSDDDSYFAKNLPSPKSGRSYSYSSTGSAHPPGFYQGSNAGRESDASLSFSDESDDEMHQQHGVHVSPMIQPKGTVADMNLYPQRITRMHSVSSLVSSASSDDGDGGHHSVTRSSNSSVSSYGTSGTTSDPSVKAELREVGAEGRPSSQMTQVSGRRSPVMGQHGIPGYFYSSPSPVMSPPPIMQGYAPQQGLSHPQPHPISQEQMAAWVQGTSAGQYPMGQIQGYGATSQATLGARDGGFQNIGDRPTSVPLQYGEQDQPSENFMTHYAGGTAQFPSQGGQPGGPGASSEGGQIYDPYNAYGNGQQARGAPHGPYGVSNGEPGKTLAKKSAREERGFQVYWRRWLMLLYMSVLNLLSDWTCYSVAPISLLTEEAFGNIDPERLVVVFLGANALGSISEPIILSRLGLRRTVLFGSLLLMIGSIVKSGGVPPILQSDIQQGDAAWRLYLGFFLVGLSQPLYQCTPTLLSSSWFPEEERTMATGVALNSNQLGIGFAFVFGTLLVANKNDIIPYFGLLSTLSTIVFMGALIQFEDAPPTPPSASARVVRGTFDAKLPSINTIAASVRGAFNPNDSGPVVPPTRFNDAAEAPSPAVGNTVAGNLDPKTSMSRESKSKKNRKGSSTRRRAAGSRSSAIKDSGLMAPSSALPGSTAEAMAEMSRIKAEASGAGATPPSPMMSGQPQSSEGAPSEQKTESDQPPVYQDNMGQPGLNHPPQGENPMYQGYPGMPPPGMMYPPGMMPPPMGGAPPPQYQIPYWDPHFQQQMQQQQQAYYQQYYYQQQQQPAYPPGPQPFYFPHGGYPPPYLAGYDFAHAGVPAASELDEGAEPILTITPHHLDIDIRDDQVIRSLKACFARQGFIHALVAFTASGIVINTLSTYMDYLVRLNGAPRYYTGVVGGTFQFMIMISSLIIGRFTDKSRAYYSVTIGMLVLGAFGLAECGVSLDSDRGNDLRWCLVVVAVLVGPLQPVSTELGVDVVYPLSENTVLVIQQLFSNLLSALFIPVFKALKDVGSENIDETEMFERPEYTFSFYLLIVIHTSATVFFATFNGKYLRYEHELERKADEEEEDRLEQEEEEEAHPFFRGPGDYGEIGERQSLVQHPV
jgi:hypothetical protein